MSEVYRAEPPPAIAHICAVPFGVTRSLAPRTQAWYPRTMPESQTLEQLLEATIFADQDPRIQQLKLDWEDAKTKAAALFRLNSNEQLAECQRYHIARETLDAEAVAFAEASALRQLLIEQRDTRLAAVWGETLARVRGIMEEKKRGD